MPHPLLGPTPIAKSPFHFSDASVEIPFRAAFLGEHNEDVLQTKLAYTDERIAALYADGVLVQDERVRELADADKT